MKKLLLLIFLLVSAHCFAQDTAYYKATNGITYKIYGEVKLGKGAGGNGDFVFVQSNLGVMNRLYNGASLKIRSIDVFKTGSTEKILFVVRDRGVKYEIAIEDAIDACEVIPCSPIQNSTGGVADELMKLKKLLDAGVLTQAEFDAEKKKLLTN
ncbi:SHOCT domain-containing protein [Pedobacter sp. L105]|uniref:SHOCT domain-containing protein n=1 Tax=Pedobacter sp. L105 TaxID=1641871 RepID=UPI001C2084F6|nr:SHOCT domain-containing protein [Pedobacter sp. L105]